MNPNKVEDDIFHVHHNHSLGPQPLALPRPYPPEPDQPLFLPEIVHFCSSDSDSPRSDNDGDPDFAAQLTSNPNPSSNPIPNSSERPSYISPEPHISSQFFTFNAESHSLMIQCLLERRLATPSEIRAAAPKAVLQSWRSVWKDRNEDTAYITAWKRIQDKLCARVDTTSGNKFLYFKNNSNQFVSHVNQWQDIVMSFHGDTDLKHFGLKETVDRIKQMWTVGAKFYGIPESFVRVCVAACPVCNSSSSGSAIRNKRRRFEYTESFDVPAKEVPSKLQQLAKKYKVVLCIRQKYIRYKPFMAEVKDYACHRAGEPAATKRSRILKREPYLSKRCGCRFRIRAIVPIANYNEKDKTFVYQEEGMAVFKLYAVHSGHEPGPLDGNARIMHRVVGHKNGLMDLDMVYGVSDEMENEGFGLMDKGDGDMQLAVLQQLQELRAELGLLEGKIAKLPRDILDSVCQELFEVVNRVRRIGEDSSKSVGLLSDKTHSDIVLMCGNGLSHWSNHHSEQMYGNGKETELIEDDEDSFERSLGDVVPWEPMREDCQSQKDLMAEPCKPEKWLKCRDFDEKIILDCEDSKLTKPLRHDEGIVEDEHENLVGIQVESFYQENPKWYDSPCGLDSVTDCGNSEFRHNLSV